MVFKLNLRQKQQQQQPITRCLLMTMVVVVKFVEILSLKKSQFGQLWCLLQADQWPEACASSAAAR